MHILLVHQAFASLDEAGGTRHHELARCLVQRGHQVTILCSPVSYLTGKTRHGQTHWVEKESPEPGITILRCYTYAALHRSFVHRVFSFVSFMFSSFCTGLTVSHVDLVWGTSPPIFQGITAWLLARLKGASFLFEVRDLWPAFAIAVGVLKNKALINASLWLERFLYRHADQVLVNSPGYLDHVRQRGARTVALVPNGADPEMFTPEKNGAAYRQQYGLEGTFLVVYAGAHGLSNDLGIVLEAAAQLQAAQQLETAVLPQKQPLIAIALVGDGKEKGNLQQRAQEMGLTNVHFLPPVPKTGMAEVLAASDACLAILKPLDLYKTTYPNKVFDYMAAGRPVVLAIDGVIRQVVEQAEAGLFVPPGDAQAMAQAITTLAADPQKAQQMGANGRRAIENEFNRQKMAQELAELLERMRRKNG